MNIQRHNWYKTDVAPFNFVADLTSWLKEEFIQYYWLSIEPDPVFPNDIIVYDFNNAQTLIATCRKDCVTTRTRGEFQSENALLYSHPQFLEQLLRYFAENAPNRVRNEDTVSGI